MYTLEQRERAVRLYLQYDLSCAAVIHELGYPSRAQLRNWYKDYLACGEVRRGAREPRHADEQRRAAVEHHLAHGRRDARTRRALGYPGCYQVLADWVDELAPGERRSPRSFPATAAEKVDAVVALESGTGTAAEVAEAHGVTRDTLYRWKYQLVGREVPQAMRRRDELPDDPEELREMVRALRGEVAALELRRDVLEGTIEILGKGPGTDPNRLTNEEKRLLVDALRPTHGLGELLRAVGLAPASYQYRVERSRRPDKYARLRRRVAAIFRSSGGAYGYRRVHACLRDEGVTVSEKVVARLMREGGLVARTSRRRRRHGSYQGEISKAPENLVRRDFHADAPNVLWLTDVTEFSIPAGKVYLSPVVDCFDGMVAGWVTSTSPNARMADSMLEAAVATLGEGQAP